MCEDALLLLLRAALGAQISCDELGEVQWEEVYRLATEQGVLGPAFDGLRVLREAGRVEGLEEDLYYSWLGQVVIVEERFRQHRLILAEFARWCKAKNVCVYVLKGLAFGQNYPVPEHRPCGDIDIWLFSEKRVVGQSAYEAGNTVAREIGARVNTGWYKHSQIHIADVMFENHEYLVCTREGHRHKELNARLTEMLERSPRDKYLLESEALIPSMEFNALFQAYHSMSHFVAEGISLRHVLDWATFLQRHQQDMDWNQFYADCKYYRFDRFINAMTDIAVHKLGVKVSNPSIVCESPYAEKILTSIINDTDAKVFGTPGGSWNHRRRLVQNTFKYAWKYREIAQVSPLRHVWSSVTGYFLHNED